MTTKPEKEKEVTCYHCKYYGLCFLRLKMNDLINKGAISSMFDVDLPVTHPKFWNRLYKTLAEVCLKYKESDR